MAGDQRTKPGAASVDAYLAALEGAPRTVLEALRTTIRVAAPDADETIAYDMPAFRFRGRFLVSYAAYRRHLSLFPASAGVRAELGAEIEPYLAGKGTIRFTVANPLPAGLVTRIVRIRLAEVAAGRE